MRNTPNFVATLPLRHFPALVCLMLLSWTAATGQRAVLLSSDHDFGIVKQGQKLTHTFAIRNTSASALRIDRIDLSAQGITTRFKPDIPPGGA